MLGDIVNFQEVHGILRVMIFIDAGYIREQLKRLFSDDILDYSRFLESVKQQLPVPYFIFDIVRVYYYDAISVQDKREKIQRIYIQRVRNITGFEDRLGNLKIAKKRLQQKGVDTLIAVDMLSKAYENHYDIAMLISGDEDYVPVVDVVKNSGKRVYGVFFEAHVSSLLKESFDRHLILDQNWFIDNALKGKARILEFKIPDKIKTAGDERIEIKVETSIVKGFLELSITNSENEYNNTLCIIRYEQSEQKEISIPMIITVPANMVGTSCKAFIIMYDEYMHENNIIAYKENEQEFQLI
jgi:uncharacterized LabA/DUF88 family protein